MAIPVPVSISGQDKDGHPFKEDSRTIVVARKGILIETGRLLALGSEVSIENPASGRTSVGRVVWSTSDGSSPQINQVGISLADAEELCGIKLSRENRDKEAPHKSDGKKKQESEPAAAVALEPDMPELTPPVEAALNGSKEAVDRGSKGAAPAVAESPEPVAQSGVAGEVPESPEIPLAKAESRLPGPAAEPMPATTPNESALQISAALETSLTGLDQRIQKKLEAQVEAFETKLAEVADQIAQRTRMSLEGSVARVRENTLESFAQQLRPLGDRVQGSRTELETLLAKLEKLQQATQKNVEGWAARIQDGMVNTLEQKLAPLADRLQGSHAQVEGLLAQLDELQQRAQAGIDESASRLKQKMLDGLEQQLRPLGKRIQDSRVEVEAMLGRLEEVRHWSHKDLEETAAHLKENTATEIERQIRPLGDRVKGAHAEVEALLARLEEVRSWTHKDFAESEARVRESMFGALEQQLVPLAERIHKAHTQVESMLSKMEEVQKVCHSEVAKAPDAIRELSHQAIQRAEEATVRLESYSQKVEAKAADLVKTLNGQSGQISNRLMEDLQKNLEGLVRDLQERFIKSARVFEDTTLESVQGNARKVAQEFLEASAVQLRQLAQEHLRQIPEQMAEKQKHLLNETTESLRKTMDELVEASAIKLQKLAENNLHQVTDQVSKKQRALQDTEEAFREKVSEILGLLQNKPTKKSE